MAATEFQAEIRKRIARSRIDAGAITFHEGKIGGAWPRIVEK